MDSLGMLEGSGMDGIIPDYSHNLGIMQYIILHNHIARDYEELYIACRD